VDIWDRLCDQRYVILRRGLKAERTWFCDQLAPFDVQALPGA
jgi:hypothetical protein